MPVQQIRVTSWNCAKGAPAWTCSANGQTTGNECCTPLIIEKERPVLRPVPPHANQQELATMPRMERMSHLDIPLSTIVIRST